MTSTGFDSRPRLSYFLSPTLGAFSFTLFEIFPIISRNERSIPSIAGRSVEKQKTAHSHSAILYRFTAGGRLLGNERIIALSGYWVDQPRGPSHV